MDSSAREKYSISSWFYLFSFLLFLQQACLGQEILWSDPGVGARPNLTLVGEATSGQAIVLTSPYSNRAKSLDLVDGRVIWSHTFPEHVSFPPLALTDGILVQGHQGTLWALNNENGEVLWRTSSSDSLDYPVAPPRFRDGAVFTVSRKGMIRRINRSGEVQARARKEVQWGNRTAETVPFRSNQVELSYLDQSGRFVVFEPSTLASLFSGPMAPETGSDVLAGAFLADGETLWITTMPGMLRAIDFPSGEQIWATTVGNDLELWSKESELLAVPSPRPGELSPNLLLTVRDEATIYNGATGALIKRIELPSDAVNAPAYELESGKRWLLCENHLLSLDSELAWKSYPLPLVEMPHSLEVIGKIAIIGSRDGRIYLLSLEP